MSGVDLLLFDDINQRFEARPFFDGGHLDIIYIVPEVKDRVFVLFIFNTRQPKDSSVRHQNTVLGQPLISSKEDSVEHGFVKEEIAHPFRDDDVDFFNRQFNFFNFTSNDSNLISKTIILDDILSL